jgi:hypothetical protein
MDHKLTLERAITIAIKNGWQLPDWAQGPTHLAVASLMQGTKLEIIYNHGFAKSLWGTAQEYCIACERSHSYSGDCDAGCGNCTQAWAFHLQQMVIAEDPLLYLSQNLPKEEV